MGARAVGGRTLRDAIKGSEFITGLRLDWVYAYRSAEVTTASVVQLVGATDSYVYGEDSNNITVFDDAKLVTLTNVAHGDWLKLETDSDPRYRRLRFSCFEPFSV